MRQTIWTDSFSTGKFKEICLLMHNFLLTSINWRSFCKPSQQTFRELVNVHIIKKKTFCLYIFITFCANNWSFFLLCNNRCLTWRGWQGALKSGIIPSCSIWIIVHQPFTDEIFVILDVFIETTKFVDLPVNQIHESTS